MVYQGDIAKRNQASRDDQTGHHQADGEAHDLKHLLSGPIDLCFIVVILLLR